MCAALCTSCISWLSGLAPPSCPAVYLICKGVLWSSSTVSAKVLYSSHNPKWQQQHQDELQERGGSLSVIYNALNSSTLLIVCITKNQTWGKTNKKCHFLFRFSAIESTSLSLRSRLFTSGSVWSRNRDYGGGWKPLQTAFINTIKEWPHEKRDEKKKRSREGRNKQKRLGKTGKGREKMGGKKNKYTSYHDWKQTLQGAKPHPPRLWADLCQGGRDADGPPLGVRAIIKSALRRACR